LVTIGYGGYRHKNNELWEEGREGTPKMMLTFLLE
jgi:hypothetical protein